MKRILIMLFFSVTASADTPTKLSIKFTVMNASRKLLSTTQFEGDSGKCSLGKKDLAPKQCARIAKLIQQIEKSDLKSEKHPADDGHLYELTLPKKSLVIGEFLDEACEILPTGKLKCKKFPMNAAQTLVQALKKASAEK